MGRVQVSLDSLPNLKVLEWYSAEVIENPLLGHCLRGFREEQGKNVVELRYPDGYNHMRQSPEQFRALPSLSAVILQYGGWRKRSWTSLRDPD